MLSLLHLILILTDVRYFCRLAKERGLSVKFAKISKSFSRLTPQLISAPHAMPYFTTFVTQNGTTVPSAFDCLNGRAQVHNNVFEHRNFSHNL